MNSPRWQGIRDIILFFAGLVGIGYEAIAMTEPRTVLIALYGGMLGFPFAALADRIRSGDK